MRSMLIGAEPVYGETCSFELIVKAKFSDGTTRDTAVSSDFAYVDGVVYRLNVSDEAPASTPGGTDSDWDDAWDNWEEDLEGLNDDWGRAAPGHLRRGAPSARWATRPRACWGRALRAFSRISKAASSA